jgi:hypothetical protein
VNRGLAAALLLLATSATVAAHEVERVDLLLAEIAGHQRAVVDAVGDAARAEATFRLGETVEAIVDALNRDVATHGTRELFPELVTRRLQAQGLDVAWAPGERRYAYDLMAFRDYLQLAPKGVRAADARFKLVARRFYATLGDDPAILVGTDVAGLRRAVAEEERFLAEHASHARADTVRFFLAVDHYRIARNETDPARRREHARRARQALTQTVERSAEPFEVRAAQTLLDTLSR